MEEKQCDARARDFLGKCPQLLELAPACVLHLALALSPVVDELREAGHTLRAAEPFVRFAVDLGNSQLVLYLGRELRPDRGQLLAVPAPAMRQYSGT